MPISSFNNFFLKAAFFCTISAVLFVTGMDKNTDNCAGCNQKERCGRIYEKLGKSEGPNVTRPVILAFLLPMVVFIGSLAGATQFLQDRLQGTALIVVTFSAAFAVTLATVIIIWAVRRLFKQDREIKGQ
jgi:hypothetical protein